MKMSFGILEEEFEDTKREIRICMYTIYMADDIE
jgi:hypothetical protein